MPLPFLLLSLLPSKLKSKVQKIDYCCKYWLLMPFYLCFWYIFGILCVIVFIAVGSLWLISQKKVKISITILQYSSHDYLPQQINRCVFDDSVSFRCTFQITTTKACLLFVIKVDASAYEGFIEGFLLTRDWNLLLTITILTKKLL